MRLPLYGPGDVVRLVGDLTEAVHVLGRSAAGAVALVPRAELALERVGFRVTAMPDGLSGLEAFRADRPDIALLDVMVPGMDGVSLCRRIRDESTVPVIMLSARADSIDVVLGLEAGADDYVTKPFDGAVLVARIRAVLRRFGHAGGDGAAADTEGGGLPLLRFGDLEIDTDGMIQVRAKDTGTGREAQAQMRLLGAQDQTGTAASKARQDKQKVV